MAVFYKFVVTTTVFAFATTFEKLVAADHAPPYGMVSESAKLVWR